jgi:hypothetical protein
MNGRLRTEIEYRWRAVLIVTLAVVGAIFTLLASSPLAGVITILSGAVLTVVLNPAAHSPPRPGLSLVAVRETRLHPSELVAEIFKAARGEADQTPQVASPSSRAIVVGRRRPLEVEAVVSEGLRQARGRAPGRGPLASLQAALMPLQAPPTDVEFKEFDKNVDAYGKALRQWTMEAEEYLTKRSFLLVADVELNNQAKLDAEDARVLFRFPIGFRPPDKLPSLGEAPVPPAFPRRQSAYGQFIQSVSSIGPPVRSMPIVTHPAARNVQNVLRRPHYRQLSSGELEVGYSRQTIHHGELATAGESLIVESPQVGTHEIAWEIHAKNLPNARKGVVIVVQTDQPFQGDPIESLVDLEAVLEDLALGHDS